MFYPRKLLNWVYKNPEKYHTGCVLTWPSFYWWALCIICSEHPIVAWQITYNWHLSTWRRPDHHCLLHRPLFVARHSRARGGVVVTDPDSDSDLFPESCPTQLCCTQSLHVAKCSSCTGHRIFLTTPSSFLYKMIQTFQCNGQIGELIMEKWELDGSFPSTLFFPTGFWVDWVLMHPFWTQGEAGMTQIKGGCYGPCSGHPRILVRVDYSSPFIVLSTLVWGTLSYLFPHQVSILFPVYLPYINPTCSHTSHIRAV